MSELQSTPVQPPAPESPQPRKPSRLRRFFLHHLPLSIAGLTLLTALLLVGAYFYMSSEGFQNTVRRRLIAEIERITGGRAEIAQFHWRLLHLQADVDGLVIHGLEGPAEAPYARIDHLSVDLSVLGFITPRIQLDSLTITRPAIHLIVYPDGSTNQPRPRQPRPSGKPALDQLFDLRAGRVAVSDGYLDYDNRAATFDAQNRLLPLDFTASDVSLLLRYIPAQLLQPESFHIEAGASDLDLTRTLPKNKTQSVHALLRASLDLRRNAAILNSLTITAHTPGGMDRTLNVTGTLTSFTHPEWQSKIAGDFDMRLLDPITGYPFAPEGLAHLDLTASGRAGAFTIDGLVHAADAAYVGTGVDEHGIQLDARVHADPNRLLIDNVVARLHQGGQVEGAVDLIHWLPQPAPPPAPEQSAKSSRWSLFTHKSPPPAAPAVKATVTASPQAVSPITIPVDGKVTANFKNVSLDTVLDMVSQPPFQRLGLDTRVNGPTTAIWTKGDVNTLSVAANLGLIASASTQPNEVPAFGALDATYTQRDGSVALRRLELHLPASEIEAHGQLGAYPLTSPTALSIGFHSGNFAEFDAVLRSLGLHRNGRAGAAALPVSLAGQADFTGAWAGSLMHPRLNGHLKGADLGIEMPAPAGSSSPARYVHIDSLEADGSYASQRIAVLHATAERGKSKVVFAGTLDAADPDNPAFGQDSVLHLHAQADALSMDDVQPFLARPLPVSGTLNADIQADGPMHDPSGSGWVELTGGAIAGEPVSRLRAQGTLAHQSLTLTALNFTAEGGAITGSGSYNLRTRAFQAQAQATNFDLSRIEWLRSRSLDVAGKLNLTLTGSGTPEDPRVESRATVTGLALAGTQLGAVDLTAHTAAGSLQYDLATRFEGAALTMHGQTALQDDYASQAQLSFSQFNIGAILRLAHVESITAESSLAGTVTVSGPLRHPDLIRGDARLQELAVTLAGVHLQSAGGVHATLANARVQLDPLHVTGDNTDLHVQGTFGLKDRHQLDLAAGGSVNLKLAETLDPDLTAGGTSTFQVEAHGPLSNPGLQGRIDFDNGSLSLEDLPNGLSQLHGTLEFNQNRLEVKTLTALSGGGLITVGGSLSYQHGIYASLTAAGKGIRIRYPEGVSSLADANLRLEGSQSNLLLSGDVLITRFTASADLDIAALAAQAGAVAPVTAANAPSNHVRLDVRVVSSPQLNFQNAFAKLAGDVDLRVRGTLASPSLLGRVSITQGNALIAGTRYELQQGEIAFTNPVRIEPVIDLTATARVEDYDITLGLHGTTSKLAVTYRSDPPMPEADVVSLLALGHTESQQRLYTQQQEQALASPTTDALLGGALNATVSSRVEKLFGAGSVKVDPNYLGAFGNSTSRITVQEQIGRNVVLTYATDVNTTGQQLLQAEVAINRHVSLVVARDESGVFSMVLKAVRRYR
jgi:translocation and assembly module TamB